MSTQRIVTLALMVTIMLVIVYTGRSVYRGLKIQVEDHYAVYDEIDDVRVNVHTIPRKLHEEL